MQDEIAHELETIQYPRPNWVEGLGNQYDVAIIGAGMAGISAAFALKLLGIHNIQLFDQGHKGSEGPWATYARMPVLRSPKDLVGPALDMPKMTFRHWYETRKGRNAWFELGKIPRELWMDYLQWLRETLELPVRNNQQLKTITPQKNGLLLTINETKISTSKVILSTGRGGFGGACILDFATCLPKGRYAHTNERIDFLELKGKRVGIIGAGASGFDAAATALENHSSEVNIFLRREHLPCVNKGVSNTYAGFMEGYHQLSDLRRWKLMYEHYRNGVPPPIDALERLKGHPNFKVNLGTRIEKVSLLNDEIHLNTNRGTWSCDFLIFATGFAMDGARQPELSPFFDQIRLWKDQKSIQGLKGLDWFYQAPYLGKHFQFLEKKKGQAPFLKNIYCFNYAAVLSHGQVSGDIPGIGIGAMRLAKGIASDFFSESWRCYYHRLQNYQMPDFDENNYDFFKTLE